jgi:hypothetical protein
LFFIILNLFRASCFEFRAFSFGHLKLFRSAGPLSDFVLRNFCYWRLCAIHSID